MVNSWWKFSVSWITDRRKPFTIAKCSLKTRCREISERFYILRATGEHLPFRTLLKFVPSVGFMYELGWYIVEGTRDFFGDLFLPFVICKYLRNNRVAKVICFWLISGKKIRKVKNWNKLFQGWFQSGSIKKKSIKYLFPTNFVENRCQYYSTTEKVSRIIEIIILTTKFIYFFVTIYMYLSIQIRIRDLTSIFHCSNGTKCGTKSYIFKVCTISTNVIQ